MYILVDICEIINYHITRKYKILDIGDWMKKEVKCYKCGKVYQIDRWHPKKLLECSHCHANMAIDYSTQRLFKYVRILIVTIIVAILMYGCSRLGNITSYIAMIITVSIAIVITQFSDQICLIIVNQIFGLKYEMYIKQDKRGK